MLRGIILTLSFATVTLAVTTGTLRIIGSKRSGQLQYYNGTNWGDVCRNGFDDEAGDVACRQLGYLRSSHVYTEYEATYTYDTKDITVCHTKCTGDEDKLRNCQLDISKSCRCYDGVVGIACTNSLTGGMVAGIIMGILLFIASIIVIVTLCICCSVSTCPCYYRGYHTTRTVVVTQSAPSIATAATTASAKTTKYQPPAPPPDTGYQPVPPTVSIATK